jgi:hypothetical protein
MLNSESAGAPRDPRPSVGAVVLFLAAGCGGVAPADRMGAEDCGSAGDTGSVVPIAEFEDFIVFDQGGVTAVDRGPVFAGLDTNSGRRVVIIDVDGGTVPLPVHGTGSAPLDVPVPVALGDDRWGLLWVDAEPIGESPEWPSNLHTRLWFSEYREGWTTPTRLLQALIIHWPGVRPIEPVPGRGAYVMVAAASLPQGRQQLYFGPVEGPLVSVGFPDDLSPMMGGFVIDSSGRIIAVAEAVAEDGDRRLAAVLSPDWGVNWSEPRVIAELNGRGTEFRIHLDDEGLLHVLRTRDWSGTIRHLTFGPNLERLADRSITPPVGAVMGWVSGFDRCGRLTLVVSAVDADQEARMLLARFDGNAWAEPRPAFPEYYGAIPLDGMSHDGRWWLAWSGGRSDTYPPPIHLLTAQP